jgi:hypothetical protein
MLLTDEPAHRGLPSLPDFPRTQFIVAVRKGSKTRFFYGETRTEAIEAAGIKPGEPFAYARFDRDRVQSAYTTHEGGVVSKPYRSRYWGSDAV